MFSLAVLERTYDASGASATVDVGGGDLLVFNNLALQLGAGDFLI